MFTGLLPIGSVVLLKESTKKVMIIGFCQKEISSDNGDYGDYGDNKETLWDYAGCLYPEGYIGPTQTYLFNGEQIDKIFAAGYQDEEQFEFKTRVDAIHDELRGESGAVAQ